MTPFRRYYYVLLSYFCSMDDGRVRSTSGSSSSSSRVSRPFGCLSTHYYYCRVLVTYFPSYYMTVWYCPDYSLLCGESGHFDLCDDQLGRDGQ